MGFYQSTQSSMHVVEKRFFCLTVKLKREKRYGSPLSFFFFQETSENWSYCELLEPSYDQITKNVTNGNKGKPYSLITL